MTVKIYDGVSSPPSAKLLRDVQAHGQTSGDMLHDCLDALARLDVKKRSKSPKAMMNWIRNSSRRMRRLITYMMEDSAHHRSCDQRDLHHQGAGADWRSLQEHRRTYRLSGQGRHMCAIVNMAMDRKALAPDAQGVIAGFGLAARMISVSPRAALHLLNKARTFAFRHSRVGGNPVSR
jgi:hypothetical protein